MSSPLLATTQDLKLLLCLVRVGKGPIRGGKFSLKAALVKKGLRLIVVDQAKVDNELVRDTSKILTSFSRRVSLGGYVASGWRPRRLAG